MRKILIVIDMQNDFIDGSLGTKEAEAIVPLVREKIASFDPGDIYATRDTHSEDYLQTQEGTDMEFIRDSGFRRKPVSMAFLLRNVVHASS